MPNCFFLFLYQILGENNKKSLPSISVQNLYLRPEVKVKTIDNLINNKNCNIFALKLQIHKQLY